MQDDVALQAVEQLPSLEERTFFRWPRFLLESVVAIGGALVVTGLISLFHLYPQIPNISLVYLLVILLLASTFGRYAAVLASITSWYPHCTPLRLLAGRNGLLCSSFWWPRS